MPQFRWSAVDSGGEIAGGVMEARDRAAVVERLQRQGRLVLRAEPADRRRRLVEWLQFEPVRPRRLDRTVLSEVTRELAIMLGAGQDLDRALRFVVENAARPQARAILDAVRERVRGGSSLAAALALEPRSFPPLYVGLVRAGESGGSLPLTLERLATLLERQRALRASLQAALVYPALLVVAAILSIVLLLDFVLPQFQPIFEQAGVALPAPTRALMALGDAAGAAAPWVLLGVAAVVLAARRMLARPGYRLRVDRLLLRLPVVGRLLRETIAARLTRTLGTLLQNGVALIPALGIATDAVGNLAARAAVEAAAEEGAGLARPLRAAGLFPPRMIHLLQLGEEAAQLPAMALKAAEIHDEQARLLVQRLVALLVPGITIAMGLAVAGIIAALLTAMLSLNDLAA
jgi:general secretion pathway protein F